VKRWSVQLPQPAKVTTATFPHDAVIQSPVRIKGDRSLLHKYINRNMVAIGIAVDADGDAAPYVQVMLVDTVSGRLLHTATHPGCTGPVRVLLGEHWLVYTAWSPSSHQYLITASEMYSNVTASDDVLSLVLGGPVDYSRHENQFDSFSAPLPHVASQTYAFATSIAALGTTFTRAGVTPKQVLIATAAGQLLTMDKRLLDPRRPVVAPSKMSMADREEMLIPYSPSLGAINPQSIVSYTHQIARPRALIAAPTTLESTSLVCTYGLDLFLTRVAPAREFDRLNDDFNYVALVGATAFLLIATIGSSCYSSRRDLVKAWK